MPGRPAKAAGILAAWARSTIPGQRLLLAAKAALAVGVAWFLAPHVPGVAEDYPYYAPLGALVSMYPSFMGSVRAGTQTLAGLLLGIGLAAGVLAFGQPNIVSISLAVGVGVLLGGQQWLGAGRDYVPVAALFVLIVGGPRADSFSIGYAVQMSLGVVVGLVVNVTVFPPLTFDRALLRLSRLRNLLAGQLDDIAAALQEHWPPAHEDWAARTTMLDGATREVRRAVHEAHESRKGNPRARRHPRRHRVEGNFDDLAALEQMTFHVRNLSEVLAGAVWGAPFEVKLDAALCPVLSDCLKAVARVMVAWDEGSGVEERLADAGEALGRLMSALENHVTESSALGPPGAVAMDVQRILAILRRRLVDDGDRH
ncbi:FUSC family protein [Specibacter sp. RAF43]|uniref:FUSC family protein n=1 Tax=Specibacter sp. RAF43 TaxID=3233057 RepID=UPI003F9C9BB8